MQGYKLFMKKRGRWNSPHFTMPKGWKIKKGAILRAKLNEDRCNTCGEGVNFFETLYDAANWLPHCPFHSYEKEWIIWLGETTANARYCLPLNTCSGKARTSCFRLLRKISLKEIKQHIRCM